MPSGLAFPLTLTALGRFALAEDQAKYRQNIRLIVSTFARERWYEPDMGTTQYKLLFRNIDTSTLAQIKSLVTEAISKQEPRIQAVVNLREDTENLGTVIVSVAYRVKVTEESDVFEFSIGGF